MILVIVVILLAVLLMRVIIMVIMLTNSIRTLQTLFQVGMQSPVDTIVLEAYCYSGC